MDRLDAMAAFVAVAEQRGFAAGARRLGLSPSSATRLVAALEEQLGTRLLQRTTRAVTLTASGARYAERARHILAAVAEAEGAMHAERGTPSGRFVVAAPNIFGRWEVAPLVCDFLARYPAVVGELMLSDRMVHLVEEGVDVAVRIAALDDSTLVARKVGETRRVVVAAPAYLAKRKKLRVPTDLASHTTILFSALTPTPEWRFASARGEERLAIKPVLVTNSADAAISHAERGGGVAMVLAYQVRDAVRAGRLAIVLAKYEPKPLPIQLVYPSTRLLSANVRAFIDLTVATRDWHFVDL